MKSKLATEVDLAGEMEASKEWALETITAQIEGELLSDHLDLLEAIQELDFEDYALQEFMQTMCEFSYEQTLPNAHKALSTFKVLLQNIAHDRAKAEIKS